MRARYLYALARQVQKLRVCWPCSKQWITENPFAKAATSIYHWWRDIFTIMPDGRSLLEQEFPDYSPAASSAKSFPGIFHC